MKLDNISQSGARLQLSAPAELDQMMTVTIPGLSPRACTLRWSTDDRLGIAFIDMVPYAEFAAWLAAQDVRH